MPNGAGRAPYALRAEGEHRTGGLPPGSRVKSQGACSVLQTADNMEGRGRMWGERGRQRRGGGYGGCDVIDLPRERGDLVLVLKVPLVMRGCPWQALLWCFVRLYLDIAREDACECLPLVPVLRRRLPLCSFSLEFLGAELLQHLVPLSRWSPSSVRTVYVEGRDVVHAVG